MPPPLLPELLQLALLLQQLLLLLLLLPPVLTTSLPLALPAAASPAGRGLQAEGPRSQPAAVSAATAAASKVARLAVLVAETSPRAAVAAGLRRLPLLLLPR